jgi:hypothetical protein
VDESEAAHAPQNVSYHDFLPCIGKIYHPWRTDKISVKQLGETRIILGTEYNDSIFYNTNELGGFNGIKFGVRCSPKLEEVDSTTSTGHTINNAEELRVNEANDAKNGLSEKVQVPVNQNQNYPTHPLDCDVSSYLSDNQYPFDLRGINHVSKGEWKCIKDSNQNLSDSNSEAKPAQRDLLFDVSDVVIPTSKRRKVDTNGIVDEYSIKKPTEEDQPDKHKTLLPWSQTSSTVSTSLDQETLSVGSLEPTEITQPSQGIFQSNVELDHLLDPSSYYDKLDELESRVAEMVGLDYGFFQHVSTGYEVHSTSEENRYALEPPSGEFAGLLNRIGHAILYLNSEGFCGDTFSVLVEDQFNPHVANAVHISLADITSFYNTYFKIASALFDKILGCEGRKQNQVEATHECHIYTFLQNLLPLALVSFTGSHVCKFDLNLWGEDLDEIPIGLGYSLQSRELACLKGFVGGPAWVLGRSSAQEVQTGFKVSLTVQDIQELWGPIWLVGGTADEGPIIRTERGFISPLPREEQTSDIDKGAEIDCHWTKEVPGYINREDRVLLTGNSRILIGTDSVDAGGLAVNLKCEARISHIQQHISDQFQLPGTCNDYYTMEGQDIQLTGGQYVSAGVIIKRKRVPGKTHKDILLSTCCNPKIDIRPLLKLRVGLEISACTGNARRITLWDALRLSQTTELTGYVGFCKHEVSDPECIQMCWTKLHTTTADSLPTAQSASSNSTIDKALQVNKPTEDEIRQLICSSIQGLEYTGIDAEGNLQAYWPFLGAPTNRRIAPTRFNKWLDILTDTRDMSTFAVVSQRCLNFREGYIAGASPSEICSQSYRDSIQKTCLSIRVVPRPIFEDARPSRRFKIKLPPTDSYLTDLSPGSAFRIGKRQLYVKKSWKCLQKIMVAYTSSKFDLSSKWTGVLDFREELNPEIKGLEAVDVIICSKEYGDS